MPVKKLIGPFRQIVSMDENAKLSIHENSGILIDKDIIINIDGYSSLVARTDGIAKELIPIKQELVLLPGFIDAHTHICFAGDRSADYALRSAGKSYLEIASAGGGIMTTVHSTRKASLQELTDGIIMRAKRLLSEGITTCEVKSGYGLTVRDELKMLYAIKLADDQLDIDLIATALPAHICPPEYSHSKYIELITKELLPEIVKQKLATRADIFIEKGAFSADHAIPYLNTARDLGFDLTIHADQFTPAGSSVAAQYDAVSADHLEVSGPAEIALLAGKNISATVLPGASLGLGMPFAPARKILDAHVTLVIASDWNPGSAPMGDLLMQASLLGMNQKLSLPEILNAITRNAAYVLKLSDRGILKEKYKADMIAFPCSDYREIFYNQGKMHPVHIWKNGIGIK